MTGDNPRLLELRRRVQSDPASIAFAALAEEFRRAGRFEEAIATCITGLQRHPSYLSAHVTLGRSLLEVGRYEEAQEELEHVLKLAPENLASIRGLAEIHHRRGDDTHDTHAQYHAAIADAHRENTAVATSPPSIDLPLHQAASTSPAAPELRLSADPPGAPAESAPPGVDAEALAGLEAFLAAIQRARAARSVAR